MGNIGSRIDDGSVLYLKDQGRCMLVLPALNAVLQLQSPLLRSRSAMDGGKSCFMLHLMHIPPHVSWEN
jgi:hypothetical protein